jgi:hypothetical protein
MKSFFAQIVIVAALVVVAVAFPSIIYSTGCTLWCGTGTCHYDWNGALGGTCQGSCTGTLCWCHFHIGGGLPGEVGNGCNCSPAGI